MRLANQPPLDIVDVKERSREWYDALQPNIPLARLPEVFARALANHASTFPVNAFEILAAWNQIRAEYAELRRKEREANPVKFCDMAGNHINEFGDVEIALGGIKEVIVPCQFCRQSAYSVRIAEELAKFRAESADREALELAESPAETIMATFQEARQRYEMSKRDRPQAKSAIGIFLQAKLAGGDKGMLEHMIDYEKAAKANDQTRGI